MVRFRAILGFCVMLLLTWDANASNPCETLLCMAGKLQGESGGSDCSGPTSDYFSIIKFGKHGKFSASKTANARLAFLTSCPAPGVGDWPMQINGAYGTVRSMGW